MNRYRFRSASFVLFVLASLPGSVYAQDAAYQGAPSSYQDPAQAGTAQPAAPVYTVEQLDQMLAPIALYPDNLVSQILMASTYPLEVVEAYRWRQQSANAGLEGDALSAALDQQPWDPSVKSLVTTPQVLKILNDNLQWTEQLGDAFLAQQAGVMNAVQNLRQRAAAAGSLSSTPQQVVSSEGSDIEISQADPQILYVPIYNPIQIYGAWPYPGYPPYYFQNVGYGGPLIGFGVGIGIIGAFWGWNHWDWAHHRIDIDNSRFAVLNRGQPPIANGYWQHNPDHRRGVPYRDPVVRAQYQHAAPDMQRSYRGYGNSAPPQASHTAPAQNSRTQVNAGVHAFYAPQTSTVTHAAAPQYHAPPAQYHAAAQHLAPPMPQRVPAPVFESFSRGADVRAQSARGFQSRATAPAPHMNAPRATPSHGRYKDEKR